MGARVVATKHWSKGDQISSLIGNYGVHLHECLSFLGFFSHGAGTVVIFVYLLDPNPCVSLPIRMQFCLFAPLAVVFLAF